MPAQSFFPEKMKKDVCVIFLSPLFSLLSHLIKEQRTNIEGEEIMIHSMPVTFARNSRDLVYPTKIRGVPRALHPLVLQRARLYVNCRVGRGNNEFVVFLNFGTGSEAN